MNQKATTLVQLFLDTAARGGNKVALHMPTGEGAGFSTLTWNNLAQEVRRLAAGFRRAGLQPGDRVAQVSENRYEWILVDLAVHLARGVHVAVHVALSAQQIAYQIADSEASFVILSTEAQAERLATAEISLPRNLQFYCYESTEIEIGGQPVVPFTELYSGIGRDATQPIVDEALRETKPSDLATILYTSGTTGVSKGVMLSHGNLTSNAIGSCNAFETSTDDIRLAWLPFSHIFARTCDLYTWLVRGSQLGVAENRDKIIAHCNELHPTLLNGVPYFFEKVYCHLRDNHKLGPVEPGGLTHLQNLLGGNLRLLFRWRRPARPCGGIFLARGRAAGAGLWTHRIVASDYHGDSNAK